MSEHQFVGFRAVDRPVGEKELDYMAKQSSRAEITEWSFENEYHFGDFRGNVLEMMRRGYDVHLHYANFGYRKIYIRLPNGLPDGAKAYFQEDSLQFLKDKTGPGGTICVSPFIESGELDDFWEFDELLDALEVLRAEIIEGDLRPLYLAHLAMALDSNHDPEETHEGPVPAGLQQLTDAQQALAEFYGITSNLIAAAALGSPHLESKSDPKAAFAEWLRHQPQEAKDDWLIQLYADSEATVKSKVKTEFQKGRDLPAWPTAAGSRTMAELEAAAAQIEETRRVAPAKKSKPNRAKKSKR